MHVESVGARRSRRARGDNTIMPRKEELYAALRDFFVEDPESIPEVQLCGVTPEQAQAMLDALLRCANPLRDDQTVWDPEREAELPVSGYRDVARLAAEDPRMALRVVLCNVHFHGVQLPDLGFGVWPDTVAVDYPAGEHWTAEVIAAYVELLESLRTLAPGSQMVPAHETSAPFAPAAQEHFREAVQRYLAA